MKLGNVCSPNSDFLCSGLIGTRIFGMRFFSLVVDIFVRVSICTRDEPENNCLIFVAEGTNKIYIYMRPCARYVFTGPPRRGLYEWIKMSKSGPAGVVEALETAVDADC